MEPIQIIVKKESQGSFSQMNWTIQMGDDSTDALSMMASLHEFAHGQLNNSSAYGTLLSFYAYLLSLDLPNHENLKEVLASLVSRSKIAHETYATWYGISSFKENKNDDSVEYMLTHHQEYEDYYKLAKNLVAEMPTSFLGDMILLSCITFCFQSIDIYQNAIKNMEHFSPGSVRSREFPDERFLYLNNNFSSAYFRKEIESFLSGKDNLPEFSFLRNELLGIESSVDETLLGLDPIIELSNHIIKQLSTHFETLGIYSFEPDTHLRLMAELKDLIDKEYPLEGGHNITLNPDPRDVLRTLILTFESEKIELLSHPPKCEIIFPSELDDKVVKGILQDAENTLVVYRRHSITLENHYEFINESDSNWLANLKSAITFIRFKTIKEDEVVIVIVPFLETSDIIAFLERQTTDISLIGCVSSSALTDENWEGNWDLFYDSKFNPPYLLNDLSLLASIEGFFKDAEEVRYCDIIIKMGQITHVCLLFQVILDGSTIPMIIPCSDAYNQLVTFCMKKKYPHFKNDLQLKELHQSNVQLILGNLFSMERFWSFRG